MSKIITVDGLEAILGQKLGPAFDIDGDGEVRFRWCMRPNMKRDFAQSLLFAFTVVAYRDPQLFRTRHRPQEYSAWPTVPRMCQPMCMAPSLKGRTFVPLKEARAAGVVVPACGAALSVVYNHIEILAKYENILVIVCGGAGVTLSQLKTWHHDLPNQATERTDDNAGRPT